ncbi:Ger(x)C family spore germination protein [Alkaliphilus serpentinus]|uniref:Ger(X)C family spore germination protein n=1 Tax=Alkaliphilus serpentinus TaxID=1482731 RepID=A0A833MD28_9FIRM|nr:Ger(x)C family spore germination protein [Alkaliphilus serpentinus]KAB3527266.1 Ger(x)C family spore germination protein [Alkaliphilus serpentinus]
MKRAIIFLILITFLIASIGCSYEDINRVIFVITIIIDVDEHEMVHVYLELFHAYRSNKENSEMGQRIIMKETGSTIGEALDKVNKSSSQKLVYSQNKVILFTEKAVKHGIDDFLDFLIRDQEMILRPYVAVVLDDPVTFLQTDIKQNEFIGLFLFDIFDRPLSFLVPAHQQFFQEINRREMGRNVTFMTAIKLNTEIFHPKITKASYAILENDKLAFFIEDREILMGMTFILDTVNQGRINIPHPNYEDKLAFVLILNSKTATSIEYDGNKIYLKKKISVKGTLDDAQGGLVLDKATVPKIEEFTKEEIKRSCLKAFNKFKDEGIDVFEIREVFNRVYPTIDIDNPLEQTELMVEVDVFIEGSSGLTDFNSQNIKYPTF